VSCAIGAYAIQNAMFDIWLMLGFGVVGYVFKKISIPLAPFTLALVLGNRAEHAFRLSLIGSGGDMKVFWSNGLVGSITTLAIVLLFADRQGVRQRRAVMATGKGFRLDKCRICGRVLADLPSRQPEIFRVKSMSCVRSLDPGARNAVMPNMHHCGFPVTGESPNLSA